MSSCVGRPMMVCWCLSHALSTPSFDPSQEREDGGSRLLDSWRWVASDAADKVGEESGKTVEELPRLLPELHHCVLRVPGQLRREDCSKQRAASVIPLQMTKALPKEEVFFRCRGTEAEEVERCAGSPATRSEEVPSGGLQTHQVLLTTLERG